MIDQDVFGSAPLWVLVPGVFVLLAGSALLGGLLRRHLVRGAADDANEGYLLSATLALLGLLISFTFAMALSRYDARRGAVVEEANAIGTTWLRAQLVEGPAGTPLRASLRDYAAQRLHLPEQADTIAAEARSSDAQARIWQDLRGALPAMSTPVGTTLIGATNEMFDAASTRRAEREARIPALVLDILLCSAIVAAGMIGYVQGTGSRRHAVVTAMLFVLMSLAIIMIVDLDRPWTGVIRVTQAPMEAAVAAMR